MTNPAVDCFSELITTKPSDRSYAHYVAVSHALKKLDYADTKQPLLKVAVLRNFTVEPLLPVLESEIFLTGFYPKIYLGDFDAITTDALDTASSLYKFKPDFIVVLNWLETISPSLTTRYLVQSNETIADEVVRVRQYLQDVAKNIRKHTSAPVFLNNFPIPVEPTLGILDSQSPNFHCNTIAQLNQHILLDAKETDDVYLIDFARVLASHGIFNCIDARHWQMARAPLSQKALVPIGVEVIKFIKALRGTTKKCLVLDCDNTLWGGIIGEDGLKGIKLGSTFPGSCYVALQEEILNLHERGVILALCSKNNEQDVLTVLREHPDMLLKEAHLATWRVNWNDKVTNLRSLAEELNIGLDSFVFIDDSDFEVNFVREQLPEVAVIQLSGSTAEYRSTLARSGYFDSLTFTLEDRRKNAMYGETRERKKLESSSGSLEDYLQKLEIQVAIGTPGEVDIPRSSQLTQKTNQFNLTTRRYSEGQIKEFVSNPYSDVFYLKVKDRIADLGLVGIAIVKYQGENAEIDSFLLSCRVIGRGVEKALLAHVVNHAIATHGTTKIKAQYLETDKNSQVKDFYAKHEFECLDERAGASEWLFDARQKSLIAPPWINITLGDTHA